MRPSPAVLGLTPVQRGVARDAGRLSAQSPTLGCHIRVAPPPIRSLLEYVPHPHRRQTGPRLFDRESH
jgi:hypothetical protein